MHVSGASKLVVDWIALNLVQILTSTFTGSSWPVLTEIYDSSTDYPPALTPPAGGTNRIEGISASDAGWVIRLDASNPFTMSDNDTLVFVRLLSPPPGPLALACPSSSAGVGVPYSDSFVATGGTPPYTFAIVAGALPPGLSLNPSTGLISGTPTTPGPYNYTGQVTDSLGATATASCAITVAPPAGGIGCPSASSVIVNLPYSSPILATGGTPPYTYSIIAGALPPGLTLNGGTGLIFGTPTVVGTYNFTIRVTDALGSTTQQQCIIVVATCPQVDSPTVFVS